MRLISHVIFLLFLDTLHGVRCLIAATLRSPAKGNKGHPLNSTLQESSLYCILVCARPSEISISVQLLGLSLLPKHSGLLCFMCVAVLIHSGLPGKSPPHTACKIC